MNNAAYLIRVPWILEPRSYSRVDQAKFVEDLSKIWSDMACLNRSSLQILKGFFYKFYLVHFWILCLQYHSLINELNVDWQSHRSGSHQKSFHKNKLLPKFYTYWTKTDIRHQFKIWFESFCEWENLQLSWVFFRVIVVTCKPVKKSVP